MKTTFFAIFAIIIGFGLFKAFENPGEVVLSWQGYEVITSTAFLVTAAVVLLLLTFWGGGLWTLLSAAPSWWKNKGKWKAQEKAIESFVEGMEALHLGEQQKAQKLAKSVTKNQPKLAALLWANLDTDSVESQKAIEHLSTAETGRVLSLLTLAKKAEAEKQWQSMKTLAEQAFALKPKAPEVIYMMFKAFLHTSHFEQALPLAEKLKLSAYYSAEDLDFLTAALCTEVGYTQSESNDRIKWYKKALQASETYIPAMNAWFKEGANEKIVTKWLIDCPHTRILQFWFALNQDIDAKKRPRKRESLVSQIARKHPAYANFCRRFLLQLEHKNDEAYTALKDATDMLTQPTVYKLLADIEKQRGGMHRAKWLEKALDAKTSLMLGDDALAFEQTFKTTYPTHSETSPVQVAHGR